MIKIFSTILAFFLMLSCSSFPTQTEKSNAELVVTYDNTEVHRRGGKYISKENLENILKQKKEFVIIFGADWCKSCALTYKAINQAKIKANVYWINIEEPWAGKLISLLGIKQIPMMMHISKNGQTVAYKYGPGKIVTYLLLRFK